MTSNFLSNRPFFSWAPFSASSCPLPNSLSQTFFSIQAEWVWGPSTKAHGPSRTVLLHPPALITQVCNMRTSRFPTKLKGARSDFKCLQESLVFLSTVCPVRICSHRQLLLPLWSGWAQGALKWSINSCLLPWQHTSSWRDWWEISHRVGFNALNILWGSRSISHHKVLMGTLWNCQLLWYIFRKKLSVCAKLGEVHPDYIWGTVFRF